MAFSIICFTKIITLAIASYLFILVGFLWCQVRTFYSPLRKKRYTLLPEGTDVHIQQHIHQKDLILCLPLYYYAKVLVELEKHRQGIRLCYVAYNQMKY